MFLFYPLYIEPGTGSALFSILIGAVATVYFLSRALIIKLKIIISGGKISKSAGAENPYVIYNEGSQYSNVFKPVLDEFEARNVNLLYLSSDKNDPLLDEPYNFVKKEFIGEDNKAFLRLNMLRAGVVLMTTPCLDIYQLKRSKGVRHYSHVLHTTTDASTYHLFGTDYFDSLLLTGTHQAGDIRILEEKRNLMAKKLITVGCTYLDVFAERIKQIPAEENHPFTVLVSPSWGPSGILAYFGEKLLDPLVKTDFRIIVRPHPQSKKSEAHILEKLETKYKDSSNLQWDYERENIYSLAKSDIMISDFSGIVFDYTFLFDKPLLYIMQGFDLTPTDADDLGEDAIENLWQFKVLKEIGIQLKEEDFSCIGDIIKNVSNSSELRQARQKTKDMAWQYRGEAGKRIADFILSLNEETEN